MDTKQLQVTLTNLISTRTNELAAFQASLSILNSTYQPNFDALTLAQKEANDGAIALSAKTAEVVEKTAELANKENSIVALNEIVSEKEALITTHEATITEKQAAIDEINQKIQDATSLEDLKAVVDVKPIDIEPSPVEVIK